MVPLSKLREPELKFGGKIWIDNDGKCSYECSACDYKFLSAKVFELHITMHHQHKYNEQQKRSDCCDSFGSDVQRNNQTKVNSDACQHANFQRERHSHRDQNENIPSRSHGNNEKNHQRRYSTKEAPRFNSNGEPLNRKYERRASATSNQLECTTCMKRFESLERLRAHVRMRHQFECLYCPRETAKTYATEKGLMSHQRNHHPSHFPYRCKVCPRAFQRNMHLKEHMQITHARGNDVKCDFCPKILMSAFEKENHIKNVHNNRRYYCFLCNDYRTTSEPNLRRHTKEKHPGQSQP